MTKQNTGERTPGDFVITKMTALNSNLPSSAARLVAIYIAVRFDSRKGYSALSIRELQDYTLLARATVVKAIKEIEESGDWTVQRRAGQPTIYRPVMERISDPGNRNGQTKKKTERGKTATKARVENRKNAPAPEPEITERPDSAEYGEETDPCLNGLPLYVAEENQYQPPVCVPPSLNDPQKLAERLVRRYSADKRIRKDKWTVEHLSSLYSELKESTTLPYEAVDILMWYQAEHSLPLNPRFLKAVLSMSGKEGSICWPENYATLQENPALDTAKMVYSIHYARQNSGQHTGQVYVESL